MSDKTVAIIGAGPAGLSAAINLIQRGLKGTVFSTSNNYLTKAEQVDNYLGIQAVTGTEMMDAFKKHAEDMGAVIENKKVSNIMAFGDKFMINANGDILEFDAVIIACGVAKAKELEGESRLLGMGVSYCATCDGMLYRGKNCIVTGNGKDSAHEANFLSGIGVKVTFVSNVKPQELSDDIVYIKGAVTKISGDEFVTGVSLASGEKIKADGVFILRDAIAPNKLIDGLELDDGFVKVGRNMQTNIKGVYAAGDCTGKPLQVAKAVGEGLIAALSISEALSK